MADSNDQTWQTIIAIWGAVVGTLAFGWNVYTWRTSGPRLYGEAVFDYLPEEWSSNGNANRFVRITINNTGDRPTTFQDFAEYYFSNKSTRFFGWAKRRLRSGGAIIYPLRSSTLGVGEVLQLLIPQDDLSGDPIDGLKQKYLIEIRIVFSHTKKPLKILVADSYNPLNVQVKTRNSM